MSLETARSIADYQFGVGVGEILFPDGSEVSYRRTGTIRDVSLDGVDIAYLRVKDGLFTLSIEGGRRVLKASEYPLNRVVVLSEVGSFIKEGKTAFAKHVVDLDEQVRAGMEVVVVDEEDNLLATGKTTLSYREINLFEKGAAVEVRTGVNR
ncbi:tRNA modification protein containing pre-PUA and PUA domain [Methanonatronarchaeum thermophilum]|uniref:tRNA modification protein containing pre-PUA and PUA domain n=1 Tax=Methanonatronarchaeum thermophilum TaxID=1927129 RepID=A0A1Y3GFW9_9EURY|nr:PUA domain-containing protein [Methanonatronarchaeum thermophilum]OUJ18266.1 tRNA modification protein containing pre-PUA and PUA domain [Methanonatronarchaeum thermophilum]